MKIRGRIHAIFQVNSCQKQEEDNLVLYRIPPIDCKFTNIKELDYEKRCTIFWAMFNQIKENSISSEEK